MATSKKATAPHQYKNFIDYPALKALSRCDSPSKERLTELLIKARELKGLALAEAAELLAIEDDADIAALLSMAGEVKELIYGKRMVLFAPLYTGNICSNKCLYCAFSQDNRTLKRRNLSLKEIESEVEALLDQGHKRILIICGEDRSKSIEHTIEAIQTAYAVRRNGAAVRRINVEIAPLTVEEFARLKEAKIGTYICFQETYDPELYSKYHLSGPKADYLNRLHVMDRAMQGGIEDVGIGALFGLAEYRPEVLALLSHAAHLEKEYGCGPHTVSVPRIELAEGSALSREIPFPVSDRDFRKIVAVLRLTLPYTGIILSTRESAALRTELFRCGVSQLSAGSRTAPGAYASSSASEQFSLADGRSLEEVVSDLVDDGFIPSFCTGCYRMGRVGQDFMDLAKPGLIQCYCQPNGMTSFAEYLADYAQEELKEKGAALIGDLAEHMEEPLARERARKGLERVAAGERDVYV